MSLVLNEVQLMQNPALGAYLLHEFLLGYSPKNQFPKGLPMPLAFLVLPLALHDATSAQINSTLSSSGLRLFQHKFNNNKDELLNFHNRAIQMRQITLKSLSIAFTCQLVSLNKKTGELWLAKSIGYKSDIRSLTDLGKSARRLGVWFSALSIIEITNALRVDL